MKIWEPKKEEVKEKVKLADPVYTLEEEKDYTRISATFYDGSRQTIMLLYSNFSFIRIPCMPVLRDSDCGAIYGKIKEND